MANAKPAGPGKDAGDKKDAPDVKPEAKKVENKGKGKKVTDTLYKLDH